MHVRLSLDAIDDSLHADAWWKGHRDERECFQEQLLEALSLLAHSPHVGRRVESRRREFTVRRLLLKKSRHLIFYSVDDRSGVVEVLRVWQANQEDPPDF